VIAPVAPAVAATEFHTTGLDHAAGASVPAIEIADLDRRTGLPAVAEPRPLVALERAAERSTGQNPVVVAGSLHLLAAVGEFAAAPWQAE
jgi:dihydrofolate synthase / folylpolyglutamate synthase